MKKDYIYPMTYLHSVARFQFQKYWIKILSLNTVFRVIITLSSDRLPWKLEYRTRKEQYTEAVHFNRTGLDTE